MLSILTLCANAQQEIDGIFYNLNSDSKTAEVVENYDFYSGKVVVPSIVEFDGVSYTVNSIGDFSFYDCGSLSQVELPSTITNIGQYAFENCASLKSINIPEGVTNIGEHAFGECVDLTKMEVPSTVQTMGAGVFGGCTSLTDIKLNEGITTLGSEAFTRCSMLETIVIPNSVSSIDSWTFSYCIALKNITLGEGIASIGEAAFAYCKNLKDIKMPASVKTIEKQAFANCDNLARVTLSKNIEKLGDRIFDSCNMIAAIKCNGNTPAKVYRDKVMDLCALTVLYVPQGAKAAYENDMAWNGFAEIKESAENEDIKDELKAINLDDISFIVCDYNNTAKVTKKPNETLYAGDVEIPATIKDGDKEYEVKYIGSGAFEYSNSLLNVTLPEGLVGIGEWAFSGCIALTDITFPASLKSIGAQAFYSCNTIPGVTIPATIESIGDCAFAGCIMLKVINSEYEEPIAIEENTFDFREDQTLYIPKGCKQMYKSTDYWWRFQNIEEDEELSISNIETNKDVNNTVYDVQGRKVTTPVKGNVYINNGKKVIF